MRIKKIEKTNELNSLALLKSKLLITLDILVSKNFIKTNNNPKSISNEKYYCVDTENINIYKKFVNQISLIPGFDNTLFKNNLKNNLRIVRLDIPLSVRMKNICDMVSKGYGFLIGGEYNVNSNVISVYGNMVNDSIWHELLHSASSTCSKGESRIGFLINNINGELGCGLNEGYTQLLTNRYFKNNSNIYAVELKYASIIEKIIGNNDMANMYSRAHLNELISSLEKYMSKKEIIDFLRKTDYINKHWNKADNNNNIYKYFIECNNFCLKLVSNYVLYKVKFGFISEHQGYLELHSLLSMIYSSKNLNVFMDKNKIDSAYQFTSITEKEVDDLYKGTSYKRKLFN